MIPLQPYQRRMIEFIATIPDGYTVEFFRGYRRMRVFAVSKDGPMLELRDGKWCELKPSAPQPERLRGHDGAGIVIDEMPSV